MSDFGSSAVRQRRLASELRRLRRRARLTATDVAAQLGWSEAKLSRIETGQARVKIADLDDFMDLYEVSGPHRAELIALAEESREADPLGELEGELPEGHAQILQAESEAQAMLIWEPQVVPGLLQVEDYTPFCSCGPPCLPCQPPKSNGVLRPDSYGNVSLRASRQLNCRL